MKKLANCLVGVFTATIILSCQPNYKMTATTTGGRGEASSVLDGDLRSGWEAQKGDAIIVDLKKGTKLEGVDMVWTLPMDIGILFKLEVQTPDGTWQEVYSGSTKGRDEQYIPYRFSPMKAQKVRATLTEGTAYINEIRIIEAGE